MGVSTILWWRRKAMRWILTSRTKIGVAWCSMTSRQCNWEGSLQVCRIPTQLHCVMLSPVFSTKRTKTCTCMVWWWCAPGLALPILSILESWTWPLSHSKVPFLSNNQHLQKRIQNQLTSGGRAQNNSKTVFQHIPSYIFAGPNPNSVYKHNVLGGTPICTVENWWLRRKPENPLGQDLNTPDLTISRWEPRNLRHYTTPHESWCSHHPPSHLRAHRLFRASTAPEAASVALL